MFGGAARFSASTPQSASSRPASDPAAASSALSVQQAHHAPSRGPERRTHGELALPRRAADQEEIRDVRARDQQHHPHRREEHQERRPYLADHLVAQRRQAHGRVGVAVGELLFEPSGDRCHLLPRARDGRARREPRDAIEIDTAAPAARIVVLDRLPEPRAVRKIEAGRCDPDDLPRTAAHLQRRSDRVGAAAEALLPEGMTDDHDPRAVRPVVVARDLAADGECTKHGEEISRHDGARHHLGVADAGDGERGRGVRRHRLEGVCLLLPVQIVHVRDAAGHPPRARIVARGLPQRDEPVRLLVGQRLQQHAMDDAEERRRGADAEGKGQDGDDRETASRQERACRDAEVVQD
ncbi:MAG TPA: hypothetical protein VM364_19830 [Vicinamibacterales bacterium]|nr:hypothetical protein [Vicinamibacterales bacterium]